MRQGIFGQGVGSKAQALLGIGQGPFQDAENAFRIKTLIKTRYWACLDIMWDMRNCQSCHQDDYSGGIASPSCLQCHEFSAGPESCNTCHGDFDDPERIAPPRDVNKDTLTISPGVGAHVVHLYENDLGKDIPCNTCHKIPQQVYDPGHVDSDLPAEIIFSEIAVQNLGISADYDFNSVTCSETYCHGNWEFYRDSSAYPIFYDSTKITGNNRFVIWNQVDSTQALCGTCHGLPPLGHRGDPDPNASTCGTCHQGIVDPDGNIIDRTKHINGQKNVFGN